MLIAMIALTPAVGALVLTGPAITPGVSTLAVTQRASLLSMVAAPPKPEAEKATFDTSISEIPKCPETVWNADAIDLAKDLSSPLARTLPLEITYDSASGQSEEEFISSRREELLAQLTANGAIWFRGFELMKSQDGFQRFYQLLELDPCQDPLASVGARAIVNKKSAMYEAVNKPSRAKFFVGMHAESTYKRTNRLGAFVCFKRAETGGEFLLLDGKQMLRDLDPAVLSRLYERRVRFSNAELPFFDFLRNAGPLKEILKPVCKSVAEFAVGMKIDMELELMWAEDEKDGLRLLALSPPQSPINRHPVTGEPSWFCNVHSHSRYLRDRRDGVLPETSGSSKLNRTDMFFGDLSEISPADLEHIDEVTRKNLVAVPMSEGEVVLVDNYQCLHGRDVFTGERLHAVTWFL
ncbi:hypothetical protein AB1Y20_009314 [Prymnesium parvum]|uniref:TauD/TfdA-like domain-containing protein n=1 Tax=Prymnesium parvum TaxID=97485 RepID=A0AB34K0D8_PRYPA